MPGCDSWLLPCSVDLDGENEDRTIAYSDKLNQSLVITQEQIKSILEYAKNKFLVHTATTDLLVIENFCVVHKIKESVPGNTSKHSLLPMPLSGAKTSQFVISSGIESVNLINVKRGTIQILVNASSWVKQG